MRKNLLVHMLNPNLYGYAISKLEFIKKKKSKIEFFFSPYELTTLANMVERKFQF